MISLIELIAAGIFILVVAFAHVAFSQHAGGLWRDEINGVGLSMFGSFGDVWKNLEFESFPIVWPTVVRALGAIGLTGDAFLRSMGFLVGLSVIAALCFLGKCFRTGPPLVAFVLLGLCPSMIIWGDSVRPDGSGLVAGLVAYGCLWRFTQFFTLRSYVAAVLCAILAVQTSYSNAIIVLAGCVGGIAICSWRRQFLSGISVLTIGVACGLSLLPYIPVLRRAREWRVMLEAPGFDLSIICSEISQTVGGSGSLGLWMWLISLAVASVLGVAAFIALPDWKVSRAQQELILYGFTSGVVCIFGYYSFFEYRHEGLGTWSRLALLSIIAVTVEGVLGTSCSGSPSRWVRLAVCSLGFAFSAPGTFRSVPFRLTNVDLIAEKIEEVSRDRDLVVVNPWMSGITYARYGGRGTSWTTLPPMGFLQFQRFDLAREMMKESDQADPLRPLLQRLGDTLKANGKVYLIGGLPSLVPGARPALLSPAPTGHQGWNSKAYQEGWSLQIAYFFQLHAVKTENLPVVTDLPINQMENLPVTIVQGWRD